jgi:hypothetical protein
VACYGCGDHYAFFDPAPGEFCIGLSGTEMVERLRDALRMPEEVVFSNNKSHFFVLLQLINQI